MDTKQRRKFSSTPCLDGKGDVSSDGRTVWVNRGICLARFCPISYEFAAVPANESADGVDYPESTIRNDGGSYKAHWELFVLGAKNRWGVEIPPEHSPLYVNET